ncbi:hypothetical protein HMPREF0742_00682 [Rothia aeria F0184]|uniref:Uncharacterized protein n=1 Tax=Rothia aeria F0184 TaxID=888019 RepID=U7V5X9_9MICC|nr:hypothetical protein HMPREF0742_00682 [Rothia aeria F0184]
MILASLSQNIKIRSKPPNPIFIQKYGGIYTYSAISLIAALGCF